MTAITIRKLPEGTKQKLRLRAAANGRSMEAEARDILMSALEPAARVDLHWADQLLAIGDRYGAIEVELLPREALDYSHYEGMFSDHP